jgi:hypothetical protein
MIVLNFTFTSVCKTKLAKYFDPDQNDWDLYLPSIVYAFNTSVPRSKSQT